MQDYKTFINDQLTESAIVKQIILEKCSDDIQRAAAMVADCFSSGHKLFFCGNGGSAADSQHLSTELVVRLSHKCERKALPALALNCNSSTLTGTGNDYVFERVFSRQIEALGQKDDVLIAITTSGTSPNILEAIKTAKKMGLQVIGLLGDTGGTAKGMVDLPIIVPAKTTDRIQEGHITIGHIICHIVERELFPECF